MSIQARRGTDAVPYALVKAGADVRLLANDQCGTTAALVAGAKTVTGVTLLQGSAITLTYNTVAGTQTFLSAPLASRTATQFGIVGGGSDTSTVDWRITHAFFHGDCTCVTTGDQMFPAVTQIQTLAPTNAVDLPTSIALANALKFICLNHAADTCAHKAADTTNAPTLAAIANAVDLPSVILVANGLKAFANAHYTQAGVHINNDTFNTNATTAASDQSTSNTLLNALKGQLVLHIPHAPGGESVSLLQ